ncbi:MAG: hypothetical protein QXK08_01925 [Candidatus Woesearchaeota archaeon]
MKPKEIVTMPRIIGLVLVIIAVLSYKRGYVQAALIAIAGLVLLFSNKEYAIRQFRAFLGSFRLKKDFVLVMFIDAAFVVLVVLLGFALYAVMMRNIAALEPIQVGATLTEEMLTTYNDIIGNVFMKAIIAVIIFWLIFVALYSVARSLIWLVLLGKRARLSFLARMFGISIAWCTVWFGFMVLLLANARQVTGAYLFIIMMLLYTHITTVLHYSYTKNRAIGIALKDAFGTGLGSIISFVHPYCYFFIVYVVLIQLPRLVQDKAALAVSFIVYFAFMAWYRTCMRNTLRRLEQ